MKKIQDPQQIALFDVFESHLSPVAYKRLLDGWAGVFRYTLLEVLPAEQLGDHFSKDFGRPTKELYSVAGLLLIMEFKNWTVSEATDAYMYDTQVHYALNLGRDHQSMCERTIERYQKLFRENDLAIQVMDAVSTKLIDELDIKVAKQRLDSTHIFSNMACFTRTRLMGVTIKRFLVPLKRHHREAFEALPAPLRERYAQSENRLFGKVKHRSELRQEVAEDLHELLVRFEGEEAIANRKTFKDLVTVFEQQCEVIKEAVEVKEKTGRDVLQNPSDPDATYDAHKGPGYQVQLAETCAEENAVQLITCVIPETASREDGDALMPVVEKLEEQGHIPEELYADTHYGSDENKQHCQAKGIDLVAPVRGPKPKTERENPTPKQERLKNRREEEQGEEWPKRYKSRNGIEATNSAIKRKTGMGRLRVRGAPSVHHAVILKVAGWNILRTVASKKLRKSIYEMAGYVFWRLIAKNVMFFCATPKPFGRVTFYVGKLRGKVRGFRSNLEIPNRLLSA